MRSSFRRLAIVALGSGLLASFGACRGAAEVRFDVTVPSALVAETQWFEIGAFRGATCEALRPMLSSGIPDGAASRVAFEKSERNTPRIGDLPNDDYAFAAVARKRDCTVIAIGCTEANVGDTSSVTVDMGRSEGEGSACPPGAACQAGRCVPANDNADPSVGAACSLELLGAGPLPRYSEGGSESASPNGMRVSAPAIAATPSGFVLAFRALESSGSTAKLIILPVDPSGGALSPLRSRLPRCSSAEETDGVGLTINGSDGLVALARSECDKPAALELLNFTVQGNAITLGRFFSTDAASGQQMRLSAAKSAAWRGGNGVVAYVEGGRAFVSTMYPDQGIKEPTGTFGGTSGLTGAWVVATDAMLAMLASGDGSPASPDAGAPATEGGTLRLLMAQPSGIDLASINAQSGTPSAPIEFPGSWGSLAAIGKRAIVVSDTGGPGRSATYRAFDVGNRTPTETNGITVEGPGKATAGDVAMFGDRAYFAILKQGGVSLSVYANATTTPTPLRSTSFGREPRIPSVSNVRDGRVAVAATDRRVAVAWTTATVLGPNDPAGGYAVFACTP